MAKIFIAYSTEDKELVLRIVMAFSELGDSVDYYSVVSAGETIDSVVENMIREADAMIMVITNMARRTFSNEIAYANTLTRLGKKLFVQPLVYGQAQIPKTLLHIVPAYADDKNLESIVKELHDIIVSRNKTAFEPIKQGDHSERVKEVQTALKKQGFFASAIDGMFGPATAKAVSDFQETIQLPITGEVDEATYQKLTAGGGSSSSSSKPSTDLPKRNFWLLRLHFKRWQREGVVKGSNVYYTTHTTGRNRRKEYDEYQRMQVDDAVLAYDFSGSRSIVAIFKVTQGAHVSKERGEIVSMHVEAVFDPPLPIDKFSGRPAFSEIDQTDKERLIQLDERLAQAILEQKVDGNKIPPIGFLRNASFVIRNGIEPVLGTASVANEIAELIRRLDYTDIGKMVGIFGHWGRGKTFMVEQVWKKLKGADEKTSEFVRVDFHAWKYQDTNASWAYLYEAFAQKYFEKKGNWFSRRWDDTGKRIDLNMARHGTWPIVRFLFTLAITGVSIGYALYYQQYYTFILTALGLADGVRLILKYFDQYKLKMKASEVFMKYFDKPTFKDLLGIQSEIQKELRYLLECWLPLKSGIPKQRIVLFVDDIDRCSEERIIQIIDALRVMLEDEEISRRVTVVAAVDERMLKRAIKWKYQPLLDADRMLKRSTDKWNETTLQISSEYMDKLFLSGIRLGALTSKEREAIYSQFSSGKVAPEEQIDDPTEKPGTGTDGGQKPETDKSSDDLPETPENPGGTTTVGGSESENNPSPVAAGSSLNDTNFELSSAENRLLKQHVVNMTDATPRQIRIFYFRYMLARNLLTQALIEQGQEPLFSAEVRNQLIADLLAHYSGLKSNHELMEDRKNFLKQPQQMSSITAKALIENQDALLVAEVLDVLEMVIAY